MVRIDVLSQQLDLGVAGFGQGPSLGEYRCGGSAALLTAGIRNYAIGAELVASFDDGDIAAVRIGARRKLGFEGFFGLTVVQAGDARLPCLQPAQHLRQFAVRSRARHHRYIRSALEDPLPFLLRHATQHHEAFALGVQLLVVVQAVEDLLFGFIADGAGVVEDQVGGDLGIHLLVALMAKSADDFLGVMHIHLATESLKIKRFFRRHGETEYTAVGGGHGCRGEGALLVLSHRRSRIHRFVDR